MWKISVDYRDGWSPQYCSMGITPASVWRSEHSMIARTTTTCRSHTSWSLCPTSLLASLWWSASKYRSLFSFLFFQYFFYMIWQVGHCMLSTHSIIIIIIYTNAGWAQTYINLSLVGPKAHRLVYRGWLPCLSGKKDAVMGCAILFHICCICYGC